MNILCIGNSVSVDSNRYLYEIARKGGVNLRVATLYVGGCTLGMHFRNMRSEQPAYILYSNGMSTGFRVSMKEALLNRYWDVITSQQGSHESFKPDTYFPYATEIVDYVHQMSPKAKIVVHQTWAYEQGSEKLARFGFSDQKEMFNGLKDAYEQLCDSVQAVGIIPSGELFQKMLTSGFETVHRDTFHASLGAGRYALGLLWYRMLTGADVMDNGFCDFDEEVTPEQIRTIKELVQAYQPLQLK